MRVSGDIYNLLITISHGNVKLVLGQLKRDLTSTIAFEPSMAERIDVPLQHTPFTIPNIK